MSLGKAKACWRRRCSKTRKGEVVEFPDKPEQYQAMGKFVYQFSQLEYTIRYLLSDLLELTPDQFHIITAPYDFAALCRVVCSFIQSIPYCDEATEKEARGSIQEVPRGE